MASVGLLLHPERPVAGELARELGGWLADRGHEVRVPQEEAHRLGLDAAATPDHELVAGLDVLVGLGGDGTILRAVDIAASEDVPVLGVNAGQLGYLSAVEPGGAKVALKRFLAGSYEVEERMRLAVAVHRAGDRAVTAGGAALNEVVVERSAWGHTVRLDVSFDGEPFTSYVADGLIVATPTGSTAYAFSVRGPIIEPRHRAILLSPVSPHMLFDRSLVLEPSTEVSLRVRGDRAARLSVDGRDGGELADGDVVVCTAHRLPARLVTFGRRDFHRVLRAKFGLSDR